MSVTTHSNAYGGLDTHLLLLLQVQRTREVQRAGRRRSGKPVLAVVGYTNAGKSSLLQALTRTDTGVEDRYHPLDLWGTVTAHL